METKKVYSAPEVEVVSLPAPTMLSTQSNVGMDGSMYSMFFWDSSKVDSEGFNVWSE